MSGTVKKDNKGVLELHVEVYNKYEIKDDFLGIGVTDSSRVFSVSFDSVKFANFFNKEPDLYFVVIDYGLERLNTKEHLINNATEATSTINFLIEK
jgi:hypothetical protein